MSRRRPPSLFRVVKKGWTVFWDFWLGRLQRREAASELCFMVVYYAEILRKVKHAEARGDTQKASKLAESFIEGWEVWHILGRFEIPLAEIQAAYEESASRPTLTKEQIREAWGVLSGEWLDDRSWPEDERVEKKKTHERMIGYLKDALHN